MAYEHGITEKELNAILDRLVKGRAPEEIMGQGGLVKDLTRCRRFHLAGCWWHLFLLGFGHR